MPLVVLDTNVVLSACLARGAPWEVLQCLERGWCDAFVTTAMLDELREVLQRPRLAERLTRVGLTGHDAFDAYRRSVHLVEPATELDTRCVDPDDDALLACAQAVGAHYLITGDAHLLSLATAGVTRIVTPAQFLALVDA